MDENKHYVYILYREDGITPFYVGMGKGHRWLVHERNAYRGDSGNPHKDNIIISMLSNDMKVPKRKIVKNISEEEALKIEANIIASIGREIDGGPLVNILPGGAENRTGVKHNSDTRIKISNTLKGRIFSRETREKMSVAGKSRYSNPEERMKTSETTKGKTRSTETRAKISEIARKRVRSPETRAKQAESLKRTWALKGGHSLESRTKMSEALTRSWAERKER